MARKGRYKWPLLLAVVIIIFVLLVCGAVALILTAPEQQQKAHRPITKPTSKRVNQQGRSAPVKVSKEDEGQ